MTRLQFLIKMVRTEHLKKTPEDRRKISWVKSSLIMQKI